MSKHTTMLASIAMLALTVACGPGEQPSSSQGLAQPKPPETGSSLPAASVLIAHRVADYASWKTVFDAHVQARKDASCLGHYLKRGVDDPNMVYVYCLATDVERLRSFLGSDELAATMSNAGVEGEPTITVMKPMSRDLVAKQKLPGIIIMHAVHDYEKWRETYDEMDPFRRQSHIVGHAVTRNVDDPNRVIVYHQANEVDHLRAFVNSAELRDAMRRSGVADEPDIHFIQVVDFADYSP